MYFITTKRMLEVCFSAHPNIQYRTDFSYMICDTREAEAYPPGISAGLPSSFMNCGSSVSLHAGHP